MTDSQATIHFDHDRLLVSGEINFVTAVSLWNDSLLLLEKCQKLLFDFSQVTTANSAALALLLEWMKLAKREKKTIYFQHLPAQLISIAKIASMDNVLAGLR